MREPWQTLLGHLADRYVFRDYLHTDGVPPIREIRGDDRWPSLSSGEQAMVIAAGAILQLGDCWLAVDDDNRARLQTAMRIALDV